MVGNTSEKNIGKMVVFAATCLIIQFVASLVRCKKTHQVFRLVRDYFLQKTNRYIYVHC